MRITDIAINFKNKKMKNKENQEESGDSGIFLGNMTFFWDTAEKE